LGKRLMRLGNQQKKSYKGKGIPRAKKTAGRRKSNRQKKYVSEKREGGKKE